MPSGRNGTTEHSVTHCTALRVDTLFYRRATQPSCS